MSPQGGSETRPILLPTYAPFALLVGKNGDIQREPSSHFSKKVKLNNCMEECHPTAHQPCTSGKEINYLSFGN